MNRLQEASPSKRVATSVNDIMARLEIYKENLPDFDLTREHEAAMLAIFRDHANAFITGGAGTGKTTFIRDIVIPELDHKGLNFAVTATTGIAGSHLSGKTIHSWAGIGLGPYFPPNGTPPQERDPESLRKIYEETYQEWAGSTKYGPAMRNGVIKRIKGTEVLIIDEISMMAGAGLLGYIDFFLKKLRDDERPFGGIQVICVGDFCLQKGTEVIMADGSLRKVEDVQVGESVMGPDSQPRKVLRKFAGEAPLFRVKQANAAEYVVTGNHQIALKRRRQPHRFPHLGETVTVSAKEMAEKSGKFREVFGGYKVGALQFPERKVCIEPYFLGAWLGDGEASGVRLSTPDPELVAYCKEYAGRLGLKCCTRPEREDTSAVRVSISSGAMTGIDGRNPLRTALQDYDLIDNKHIPEDFMLNSEENRLQLMAGLLDTDGCWNSNRFTFSASRHGLARQFKQLADHLGFRTKLTEVNATTNYGQSQSWTVTVGGDTWRIPTKIARKQSKPRSLGRDRLNSTLEVSAVGVGEFAGFETDGDHLFLLADGTVTHNCQLPPVEKGEPQIPDWAFLSEAWLSGKVKTIELTKVFRQADQVFAGFLNAVRQGRPTDPNYVRSFVRTQTPEEAMCASYLVPTNAKADKLNNMVLDMYPGPTIHVDAKFEIEPSFLTQWETVAKVKQQLVKEMRSKERLSLRIGVPVLFKVNDRSDRYVNGTKGFVTRLFDAAMKEVTTGEVEMVEVTIPKRGDREEQKILLQRTATTRSPKEDADEYDNVMDEATGKMKSVRRWPVALQFPLIPATAITIHSSQGMSMDECTIDLHQSFASGHVYVAMSRLRTAAGLTLASDKFDVLVDNHVLKFYNDLRQ
jgi:hypothetical protein